MREDVAGILDELSARFGATGAELWAELVRYEIATAWAWVVGPACVCVFALLVAVAARAVWKKQQYPVEGGAGILLLLGLAVTLVSGVLTAANAATLWVTLQAPQAAVIKHLF